LLNRPKGAAYHPFYFLDFMLGIAKLEHGDSDADTYLQSYVRNFKGRHYIKECYQKLAWNAFLGGNMTSFHNNMELCKGRGAESQEADKKALKEAKSGLLPNLPLLRARLYFDGGYFLKAKTFLTGYTEKTFKTPLEKLEYTYRLGRIYDKLADNTNAITYYLRTIETGKDNPAYFACNAALQLGLLYEGGKNISQSRSYYLLCLSISPSDYKDSLHQKAKAGLQRLKKV
jgi:tetratricopeptide (TPR) repeat protein